MPADRRSLLATLGLAGLVLVCCAAPLLVTAGALGALAAFFGNPLVLGAAGLALAAALSLTLVHYRRR